ncbi:MAG: hypothetical protein WC121_12765 [Candidatus Kapaibacterium sp.]
MKKLLYILPILLILISCSDDPVKFDDDVRVKTIYGIEQLYQNGEKAGDIGFLDDNPCKENEFKLVAFPNPSEATSTFIQYNIDEEKEVEVSIETAKASEELKKQLLDNGYEIRNHSEYRNFVFYTETQSKGTNSVLHLMYIFKPGAYIINIKDNSGNTACFPFVIIPSIKE